MGPILPIVHEYVCLDIETGNADPAEAEAWVRRYWSPSSRWSAETIGLRYLEAIEKKKEKLALLEAAPIVAIGINTPMGLACVHSMHTHDLREMGGGQVFGFGSERDMLLSLRTFLDQQCSPETLLVGHNIKRFDLPRLRQRFARNRLKAPAALVDPDQPVFDTMDRYARYYSPDDGPFISAGELADIFGVTNHKGLVEGSQVPELYAQGKWEEIVAYCMLDVRMECEIFHRMTGRSDDLPAAPMVTPVVVAAAPTASPAPPQPQATVSATATAIPGFRASVDF